MSDYRVITIRRTLEQIVHTAQEALSVYEHGEDPSCCLDDLGALQEITFAVKDTIKKDLAKKNAPFGYKG
jgi:hypothetical protein